MKCPNCNQSIITASQVQTRQVKLNLDGTVTPLEGELSVRLYCPRCGNDLTYWMSRIREGAREAAQTETNLKRKTDPPHVIV